MKKFAKILTLMLMVAVIASVSIGLVACDNDKSYSRHEGQVISFTAPEGTPALAMLRLVTDNKKIDGTDMKYSVVNPDNIAIEMSGKKSDIVIMPVNVGANLIRSGQADYKLVSVAVEGSLYIIGGKAGSNTLTLNDLKGKKIACIGQNGVPGLIFRYVMNNNDIEIIDNGTPNANQVLVQYVGKAPNAMTLLADGKVDFAVVGEPAVTQFKNTLPNVNAELNLQTEYAKINPVVNGDNYPQAGLFVRTALANDKKFMDALFDALDDSKDWVEDHPLDVTAFAKANLYESAAFPAVSIPRCAIDCDRLDAEDKAEIIAFLKNVMTKDISGNVIDWDDAKRLIF